MRVPEATFQQVMGVDRAAAGGGVHLASGHKEPFKVRKRDGDEGGKTPLKAVPSAGPARGACRDARVVLWLGEPNLQPAGRGHDREGPPSVAIS